MEMVQSSACSVSKSRNYIRKNFKSSNHLYFYCQRLNIKEVLLTNTRFPHNLPIFANKPKPKTDDIQKILLYTIAILFSGYLQAQSTFTQKQQQVQQAIVKMFEDLSNRDAASLGWIAHLMSRFTSMGRSGI